MQKITTFLTFNNQAEEAANFYTSIFDDAKVTSVNRIGTSSDVLTVTFEMFGQEYVALNGGPDFKFTTGVSLMVNCESQEEVDRYWSALLAGGGEEVACGWLTDRYGFSWQITPTALMKLINDPDSAKAQRVVDAMMKMIKIDIAELERAAAG